MPFSLPRCPPLCRRSFRVARPDGRTGSLRYHGILAPNARDRSQVVPPATVSSALGTHSRRRWGPIDFLGAAPLARVFALDVTACPAFGGRLGLITALKDSASVRRYLQGVGLPTEPPPIPPRAPQQEWDFAA